MAHGPRQPRSADLQVSEEGGHFYAQNGPAVDSKTMNETPGPMDRYDEAHVPATPLRWDAASTMDTHSPDIRKFARTQAEVERDRPREVPGWVGPLVGVVTFFGVMGVGCVFMFFWFTRVRPITTVDETTDEAPTELDGLPVRKNFKNLPEE